MAKHIYEECSQVFECYVQPLGLLNAHNLCVSIPILLPFFSFVFCFKTGYFRSYIKELEVLVPFPIWNSFLVNLFQDSINNLVNSFPSQREASAVSSEKGLATVVHDSPRDGYGFSRPSFPCLLTRPL